MRFNDVLILIKEITNVPLHFVGFAEIVAPLH